MKRIAQNYRCGNGTLVCLLHQRFYRDHRYHQRRRDRRLHHDDRHRHERQCVRYRRRHDQRQWAGFAIAVADTNNGNGVNTDAGMTRREVTASMPTMVKRLL